MNNFLNSLKNREVFVDDNPEYDASISDVPKDRLKPCAICGKPFIKKGRGVYCGRQHYVACLNCGNRVNITQNHFYSTAPKTCSKSCADLVGVSTFKENCISKYGVSNPMLVPELVKDMISKRNPDFDFALKEKEQIHRCEVCGKEFKFDYTHPRKTCSEGCAVKLQKASMPSFTKICELCGKKFTTSFKNAKYCEGPHYRNCIICGNQFELKDTGSNSVTCSEQCRLAAYKQTCMNRYGVEIGSQSEQAREKLSIAGKKNNPKQPKVEVIKPPIIKNCRICNLPFTLESNAQHICNRQHYRNCDVCGKQYEFNAPWTQLCCSVECTQSKRVSTQKNSIGSDGTPLDSSWEKIAYDFWKSLDLEVERNIPIQYEYNGKSHTTFIDFRVEGMLFEVKGNHLLNGDFDYSGTPIEVKLDIYKKHHVIIITEEASAHVFGRKNSKESNGLKYLNICPNPLIGISVTLFKDVPRFPYADDRPKCFYDVQVNGKLSSHDAFYDKKIRWNIIKNRIQHVGGFIDAKEVLNGLNVTRIAKQPSWFSKTFAKNIITKYCTSDIIVDSFAGWGARCDATVELDRLYIGCDLNQQLVDWHKEHNRNIVYDDATNFKYDGKCSVFICPPYQDVEVYFKGQNSELTQCQWLEIVMKNIPNANEYVMVCKVVDPGWEKYIVEIKENKSHFGTNKEYVIVVPNLYYYQR